MKRLAAMLVLVALAAAAVLHYRPWAGGGHGGQSGRPAFTLGTLLSGEDTAGFARAEHVRAFHFPADYGPHPRYRSEWWYFTGNLHTAGGRRFGYELTVFRFALAPHPPKSPSPWATNQVYMAHFALTDVAGGQFHAFQRLARGAVGLAGARAAPFKVWVGDWSVAGSPHGFPWHLHARHNGIALDLTLTPSAPIVLQGDHGLSRKSSAPGNASYYYSIPRLATRGQIRLHGQRLKVQGDSWLDREWSTSALGPDQSGWDWFALQLSDGSDLMFYRLRRKDGTIDPHSAGTLVSPDGRVTHLTHKDVTVRVLDTWRSPDGTVYPARWELRVRPAHLKLRIRPLLADQEVNLAVRYWEGAVSVGGHRNGHSINGHGYVELAGYGNNGPRTRAGR
ncbi:MAG TPA: lipocalin-like domain-containing protein [Gammaproteobacteria bacterium]|nr:lipocalin-like domain-containing protein [Gammaproteobacteria bacterium]